MMFFSISFSRFHVTPHCSRLIAVTDVAMSRSPASERASFHLEGQWGKAPQYSHHLPSTVLRSEDERPPAPQPQELPL